MACSAQTPKPCDLCEEEINVEFMCIECRKLMCNRCKGVHKNVPTLSNHQIVEIKNAPNLHHIEQNIHVDCMVCSIHTKNFHCLYCKSCNEPICPECVSSSHIKHDYEPINSACEKKLENLKEFDARIENVLKKLQKLNELLQNSKSRWELDIAEAQKCVDKNEEEIKEEVTKRATELRHLIEEERKKRNLTFDTKQNQIVEKQTYLTNQLENTRSAIQAQQGEIIFATESEMSMLNLEMNDAPLPTETISLSPPEICTASLNKMFGSLNHISMPSTLDIEITSNYFNIPGIDKMVMAHDGHYWISTFGSDNETSYLMKTKITKTLSKTKYISIDAFDMALMADDTLLVSVHMTSEVKRVTKNNVIEPFIDVSPLIARGIAVSKNNEVILGVREKGEPYEITDDSRRQILVFTSDGTHKKTFEFGENKERLITIPRRLCIALNGDIIVSDSVSHDRGRIVSIGKRGEVRWKYDGQSREHTEKNFDPDDMIVTSSGYIVLTDERAHSIYILSVIGDLILQKDLRKFGIVFPRTVTVAVDSNSIWIGCATHRLKQETLKKKRREFPDLCCLKLICR